MPGKRNREKGGSSDNGVLNSIYDSVKSVGQSTLGELNSIYDGVKSVGQSTLGKIAIVGAGALTGIMAYNYTPDIDVDVSFPGYNQKVEETVDMESDQYRKGAPTEDSVLTKENLKNTKNLNINAENIKVVNKYEGEDGPLYAIRSGDRVGVFAPTRGGSRYSVNLSGSSVHSGLYAPVRRGTSISFDWEKWDDDEYIGVSFRINSGNRRRNGRWNNRRYHRRHHFGEMVDR